MTSKPLVDHGQTLTAPAGKVIGFLDGEINLKHLPMLCRLPVIRQHRLRHFTARTAFTFWNG